MIVRFSHLGKKGIVSKLYWSDVNINHNYKSKMYFSDGSNVTLIFEPYCNDFIKFSLITEKKCAEKLRDRVNSKFLKDYNPCFIERVSQPYLFK
jgi:hypothetical protein